MSKLKLIALIIILVLMGCKESRNKSKKNDKIKIQMTTKKDKEPKVTGIGGIFFKSKNPTKTNDWYRNNLGMEIGEYGAPFEFRNANRPEEINYLNWSVFDDKTDYLDPSNKDFMINYRVQNIEGLVKKLKENNVVFVDCIISYDYGKFVHIIDSDGLKIELWEPVDSILTKFGGKTNK
jgi:predicted enzyme related to lactoylglutathione lyase